MQKFNKTKAIEMEQCIKTIMHDDYVGFTLAMQNKAGSTFKINQRNYINRLK